MPLFVLAGVGMFAEGCSGAIAFASYVALLLILALCAIGVVMSFFFASGRLKMKCPFCGEYGAFGGSKHEGMFLLCDHCGIIRGSGPFGFKLKATPVDPEDVELHQSET